MNRSRLCRAIAISWLCLAPANEIAAQDSDALTDRAPRFLVQLSPTPIPVNIKKTPALRQRISLQLEDATLGEALAAIERASGLRFAYSAAEISIDGRVQLKASDITVAAALTEVLLGSGTDVLLTPRGQAMLVRRPPAPPAGDITGRVTDNETGQPVSAAGIQVAGTAFGAHAGSDGRYTITRVPPGQYHLTARRLGYDSATAQATVADGGTAIVDFKLVRVPSRLQEVVTTVTGSQQRLELGNAVAAISTDSITRTGVTSNIADLLDGRVPGMQLFNNGGRIGLTQPVMIRGIN